MGFETRKAANDVKGKTSGVVEHTPEALNVRGIRGKTGMNQERFCATLGKPIGTLRHWEQGLRTPRAAAGVLLKVVDWNPKAVIAAVKERT